MSEEKKEEKMDRRKYIKYVGAGAVVAAAAAAIGYGVSELTKPPPPTPTTIVTTVPAPTTIVTTVAPPPTTVVTTVPTVTTITTAPPVTTPGTVSERAVFGARRLVETGAIPKGTRLKLLHVAGSRAQLVPFIKEWEEKTGIGIDLVTVGVEGDIFTKLMAEATAKTGEYDIATVFSTWMGDLVEAGIAKPLDEYYAKYDPIGPPEVAPIEPLGSYTTMYKGKRYALFADADVYTLTYRKDLLGNPTYKEEFKSKYGYDLKVPDTWEETIDIAKFFYEKNLKAPDGERVYGAFFYAEPLFAGYTTWWTIFTSKGGILFSPKNMKSMVNTPEGIEALDIMVRLMPYMHPEAVTGTWASMYQRYSEGKAVLAMAWPSLIKWAQDPTSSKIVGKSGAALPPGSYVTVKGEKKLIKACVNPVNWVGIVSNYSKYPEAGFLFLQYWTSPEIGYQVVAIPGIMDAYRRNWFEPGSKERAVMDLAYTSQFVDVFKEAIAHSFPDLMLPGAYTFLDVLNKNINAVCAGVKKTKDALDETAAAWEEITDRLGRDKLLAGWKETVKLYPADVQEVWKEKGYI
jgi:multiple sugar transport system substrate-binding protein